MVYQLCQGVGFLLPLITLGNDREARSAPWELVCCANEVAVNQVLSVAVNKAS